MSLTGKYTAGLLGVFAVATYIYNNVVLPAALAVIAALPWIGSALAVGLIALAIWRRGRNERLRVKLAEAQRLRDIENAKAIESANRAMDNARKTIEREKQRKRDELVTLLTNRRAG